MEKSQKAVVDYGQRIEKMPYLKLLGRFVFASAFILSAWKDFRDGGVAAAELRPKLGYFENLASFIIGFGIVLKFLGGILFIFNSFDKFNKFIKFKKFKKFKKFIKFNKFNAYLGALLLFIYAIWSPILYDFYNRDYDRDHFNNFYTKFKEFVNETMSADEGVAMTLYNSMVNEEAQQKFIDQLNEIGYLAISNPLFTKSEFNTLFIRFTKGVGIAAVLVLFMLMERRHKELKKSSEKKKTN